MGWSFFGRGYIAEGSSSSPWLCLKRTYRSRPKLVGSQYLPYSKLRTKDTRTHLLWWPFSVEYIIHRFGRTRGCWISNMAFLRGRLTKTSSGMCWFMSSESFTNQMYQMQLIPTQQFCKSSHTEPSLSFEKECRRADHDLVDWQPGCPLSRRRRTNALKNPYKTFISTQKTVAYVLPNGTRSSISSETNCWRFFPLSLSLSLSLSLLSSLFSLLSSLFSLCVSFLCGPFLFSSVILIFTCRRVEMMKECSHGYLKGCRNW